jgi:hypothetical protein
MRHANDRQFQHLAERVSVDAGLRRERRPSRRGGVDGECQVRWEVSVYIAARSG